MNDRTSPRSFQPASAAAPGRSAAAVPLRTGQQFLDAIRDDGRNVFVDGERVQDVTTHPAFAGAARSIARLFDIAADPAERDVMTYTSPRTGGPVWRAWQIPHTREDLAAKRAFHQRWAEATFGFMGRVPDHVAGFFAGYAAKPSVFRKHGDRWADNVLAFYEYLRDNHQYVTYAIVPPQVDRSKPAHQQADPTLYAGVVAERDDGIVLRGAQQLATGGVFCDWLQVSCIHPLQPGDEAYAFNVAIPMNDPGLKLYSRRAFALQATSVFDYPLSSRFDETDAMVVLDDVFVPWERVFIYRNTALTREQWWNTPAHGYGNFQAQVRYAAKLRFLLGMAKRMLEMTGVDKLPPVMVQLGELVAIAQTYESMVHAMEATATHDDEGVLWIPPNVLYASMSMQSELNGKLLEGIRELTGASMITLPSSVKDYTNPEIARDLERYIATPGVDPHERVALMKLAWDVIGTEFGGRHQQYEKFYGGASFLVKQNLVRNYDFAAGKKLVDEALEGARADLAARLARGG